jgi:RNase P subunit RPR2
MSELKPCVCGNKEPYVSYTQKYAGAPKDYVITCDSCGIIAYYFIGERRANEREIIELWNTRAEVK